MSSKGNDYADVRERELLVRKVKCPVCEALPKTRCIVPNNTERGYSFMPVAHVGRYHRAAAAQHVPAMVGG